MKWIDLINRWCFTITILLYITFFWGLIAQAILGAIQILLSVILIIYWSTYNQRIKTYLISYWSLVILYGLSAYIFKSFDFYSIATFMIIPMSLASYFVYITYLINSEKKATQQINNNIINSTL